MIRFLQVSLMRGIKPLLEQVDVTLNPGDKIGLIGANGAGKSSLFAMMRGELHPDQGEIDFPAKWRVAYVAQETPPLDRAALDYAIDGDVTLRKLEAELARLESEPATSENGIAIGEIYSALADADAYTVQSRGEQLLLGLGFTLDQMQQPVASFSGGWRMRLNLAQALMCPSDLLLLDEPTNHLDLDAIIWLEDWLKRYAGTLLIISHDRDFLDEVVNVVVHIDERKLKRYSGNYSSFERQRAAQMILAAGALEKQQRKRAHLESFVNRFKAQASKARQAQSRMKALAKMEELAPLRAAAEFSFEFREPLSAPNPLLVMEDVDAGYKIENEATGEITHKTIVNGIKFSLQIGQRIGLLGQNGAGKSTLIKTIAGELMPLTGDATLGKGLNIGYFAQHQVEMLRHDESPLWHLSKIAPTTREQELRNFLGGFNFPGNMVTSSIAPFSGGEKARLALALILQPFDGDLDDYKDWLFKTKLGKGTDVLPAAGKANKTDFPVTSSVPAPAAAPAAPVRDKRKEAEERQKTAALRKPIENKIKRQEEQIAKRNAQKAETDAKLGEPSIYDAANKAKLKQLLADQTFFTKDLAQLEAEWLDLQDQLEKLG
eukprot:gene16197-19275_t